MELICQSVGANGKNLQKASDIINNMNIAKTALNTITLNEIDEKGLNIQDKGKTIIFN